jgi:hypothetical protein
MRYALIITITCLLFVSCKKDNTSPQLSYTSASASVVSVNQAIIFTLHFTDPSGGADSLFIQEVVRNCTLDSFNETDALPDYSAYKGDYGDLLVPFAYGTVQAPDGSVYPIHNPQFLCGQNDTAIFRFVLKDGFGVASDTVNSGPIVLLQ